MAFCGIVAEYNPLHRGHAHQLEQARRMAGADAMAVIMSGCFTQRGDAACLSPAARAEMALGAGADLVLLLPAAWAVRDAERFAEAGMLALAALGCDTVSFGAETDDLPLLTACARMLEQPPEGFQTALREGLREGLPHPAALTRAAERCRAGAGRVLEAPNNLLAVSYLRVLERHGLKMRPLPVRREGDAHRETGAGGHMPSATALRGALARGDWEALRRGMPEAAFEVLRREALDGRVCRADALDQALLSRLRLMRGADWASLPGLSEGIEQRLRKASRGALSREALLQLAATRRYPRARLSRLCAHALLGINQADLTTLPACPPLILLGLKESGVPILTRLKERGITLTGRASLNEKEPWVQAEQAAWDLWALGAGEGCGWLYTQKMVRG